jgi:hypothetical protein
MSEGKSAIFLGAGYEMACDVDQLNLETVLEKKQTYNPLLFAREYGSEWTGSSDKSLISLEAFQKCRTLNYIEEKAEDKKALYILSYDVAHAGGDKNANSALSVLKIKERNSWEYNRLLVNMFGMDGTQYKQQALFLKEQVSIYNAHILVIDTNGIGTAVVEELMQDLGDGNPPYSVVNNSDYDKLALPNAIPMIYTIVAHSKGQSNNDMYNEFIRIINNHKIQIPYSSNDAQLKFLKGSNKLTGEQLAEAIRPYAAIDLFVEETMNLEYKQSGNNTDVKQISRSIQKDRFSSVVYGLYWIYLKERENKEQNEETDWSQYTYVGDGKASIDQNVKWAG